MSIKGNIERVASIMDTLATADVVPNTFGQISTISRNLQEILSQLPHADVTATLGVETVGQLQQVLSTIEDNRSLFAIPERWLIENVMTSVTRIRQRLER